MKYLFTLVSLISFLQLCGQGSNIPLGNRAYHILDRIEIKTGLPTTHFSALKYYTRSDAVNYALNIDTLVGTVSLSGKDRSDLYYIFKDNNEWLANSTYPTTLVGENQVIVKKIYIDSTQSFYTLDVTPSQASQLSSRYIEQEQPILKHFYKTPANLFEVNEPFFHLRVNPLINFSVAKAKDQEGLLFANQRGLEVRGGIDDRIYFYTNILESQQRFADYVNERIIRDRSIPGQGLFKNYNSEIFNSENAYDFLNSQGYIGFNVTKHVGVQFGYGKNFIGNGYRSLLLSDFSNNYLYLKLNWRIGKFHYQNLFTELAGNSTRDNPTDEPLIKRFMTAHYLGYKLTPNLTIGFYEAIVFSRNQFDFNYLNPIIFYRTVEQAVGSPDNALVGVDLKWNLFKRFQVYGQFMLDEFKFDELFIERRGWWANKYAIQTGIKYIDAFGIDHLDLQYERNSARPYIYTHRDSTAAYTHYNYPLAHPVGANFKENLVLLKYQPFKNLFLNARWVNINYGEDPTGQNFGHNILLSHTTRPMDFGNRTGQGIATKVNIIGAELSYQLFHNMYFDLYYFNRMESSADEALDSRMSYFGGGIRVNLTQQYLDF